MIDRKPELCAHLQHTRPGLVMAAFEHGRRSGSVGLQTIERCLACPDGTGASLSFRAAIAEATNVQTRLPVDPMAVSSAQPQRVPM